MSIKWRLIIFFILMNGLTLLLFWVGESAFTGIPFYDVDPVVVLLAILLPGTAVFVYARQMAKRLDILRKASRSIAQGNFKRVDFGDFSGEFGQFASELNALARHVEIIIQQATQEARKTEAILAGMQEGVVALDNVGRVVLMNKAAERIFRRTDEQMKGKYVLELIEDSQLHALVSEVLSGGASGRMETSIGRLTVRMQVSPILSEERRGRGAVIVIHDITEIRRLEQMRTEFVANVSHELRTPLTSIKGFVETLLEGAAEIPSSRQRFLTIIQGETLRLQRLIEDLLTLARIENRDKRDNRTDTRTRVSYVQKAYRKIEPVITDYAEAKGLSVEAKLPDDLPPVAMGDDLLSQVLLNLLENGVKYTSEGRVWLHAWADPDYVHLEFGDTGCGIPEESLPRIFERFYRVDKARSRELGGTGLGLSIVKHIVEGSGGRIRVESELGKGTVFTCDLPRVHDLREDSNEG